MDVEAMESRKGQVGKRDREMGRLPEAIEGSKFDRPKELVVSRVLHDQLSNWCSPRVLRRDEFGTARLSLIAMPRLPALENFYQSLEISGPGLDRWRWRLLTGRTV